VRDGEKRRRPDASYDSRKFVGLFFQRPGSPKGVPGKGEQGLEYTEKPRQNRISSKSVNDRWPRRGEKNAHERKEGSVKKPAAGSLLRRKERLPQRPIASIRQEYFRAQVGIAISMDKKGAHHLERDRTTGEPRGIEEGEMMRLTARPKEEGKSTLKPGRQPTDGSKESDRGMGESQGSSAATWYPDKNQDTAKELEETAGDFVKRKEK